MESASPPDRARWERIKAIYFASLDLEPSRRSDYVRDACAGDTNLEQEVARLLALSEEAGSFLEQAAGSGLSLLGDAASPAASPGELLADRFRVTELIGNGGMGEVYEACDEVIGEVVALKVVRQGLEPIERLAARWRREVLLARKVSHGSVCRVHDVAMHYRTDGEKLLIVTMERLRGESLTVRLQRAALSVCEALDVLGQIGSALDAAHAEGVLHRDVKPDNIFLEPREGGRHRAVLTDFGLAKTTITAPQVTVTGLVAGTAGYIAPELLRGQPASARADLYSFGLVAREVCAGALPALDKRTHAILARAVDVDPGARFSTASEMVEALGKSLRSRHRRIVSRSGRAGAAAAAAIVLVIVALSTSYLRSFRWTSPAIAVASQVLLTDVVNATADAELDGATEILRSQLAQSPHFELVPRDRVRALLTEMRHPTGVPVTADVSREIALREGVPLVVYAGLMRLGQDYVLQVRLEQVGSRPSLIKKTWGKDFTAGDKRSIPEAVHDAAVWVRQMAGEVPRTLEEQDRVPSDTTTTSWDALRLFGRANDLIASQQLSDAALLLQEALRSDPEFAMAHARLGDALVGLHREKEGYAEWQRAIALAERRQLTGRETLRIRGQYFDDTGDLVEAEKAYRTYALHYPHDFFANFLLGAALVELDRAEEAVPWLQRARDLRPASPAASVRLAATLLDLGRADQARAVIDRLERAGDRDWPRWFRALMTLVAGDVDGALAGLEPLRTSDDEQWRSRAYTIRASWLVEDGADSQALAELKAGIEFDRQRGLRSRLADKYLHAAELECRAGDDGCVRSTQLALEAAGGVERIVKAGDLLVLAGKTVEARRLAASLDDYPQVPATAAARDRLLGEIDVRDGHVARASPAFLNGMPATRRSESSLPVARALASAGDVATAERLLTQIAEHPAEIYGGAEPWSLGLWRQAVVDLRTLTARKDADAARRLQHRYAFLLHGTSSRDPSLFPSRSIVPRRQS